MPKYSKNRRSAVVVSVSLTPELVEFTNAKVKSGLFGSVSETVREALRRMVSEGGRNTNDFTTREDRRYFSESDSRKNKLLANAELANAEPVPQYSSDSKISGDPLSRRLSDSISLLDDAVELLSAQFRRRHPEKSEAAIHVFVQEWLSASRENNSTELCNLPDFRTCKANRLRNGR